VAWLQPGDRPHLATRAFDVSQTLNIERKRAIARAAAELCSDGESIIINAGTTTFQMVDPLRHRRLQILTNSFAIAEALIATAIGLFAAIPAVVAYNRFAGDLNRLATRFDSFMEEFSNILQRQS